MPENKPVKRGRKEWRRERAKLIQKFLKRSLESRYVSPERFYAVVYPKTTAFSRPPVVEAFYARVIKVLTELGVIRDGVVTRVPSRAELYRWFPIVRKGGGGVADRPIIVKAVSAGPQVWVPGEHPRQDQRTQNFVSIRCEEDVGVLKRLARQNPCVRYNVFFTSAYEPIVRRILGLLASIPNLGIMATTLYVWKHRLSRAYKHAFNVLQRPSGRPRTWTYTVYAYAHALLRRGEKLGYICKQLNIFGIKISVRGLLKWRLRDIKGPPPVSMW